MDETKTDNQCQKHKNEAGVLMLEQSFSPPCWKQVIKVVAEITAAVFNRWWKQGISKKESGLASAGLESKKKYQNVHFS